MVGDRIRWRGVNRIESGIVEQEGTIWVDEEEIKTYEVRLDDGKYVIVSDKSLV